MSTSTKAASRHPSGGSRRRLLRQHNTLKVFLFKGQIKYRNQRNSDSWRYEMQAEVTDLQGDNKRSIGRRLVL